MGSKPASKIISTPRFDIICAMHSIIPTTTLVHSYRKQFDKTLRINLTFLVALIASFGSIELCSSSYIFFG